MKKLILEVNIPIDRDPKDLSSVTLFFDDTGLTHTHQDFIPKSKGHFREKIQCPFRLLSIFGRSKRGDRIG